MSLYHLASAFEKMAQELKRAPVEMSELPSQEQLRGELPSYPKIDPYIQFSLNNLGYQPALAVDGKLGPQTEKALDWFRGPRGIPMNTPLPLVMKQLTNEIAKQKGKTPFQVAKPTSPTDTTQEVRRIDETALNVNPESGNFTIGK